MFRGLVGMVATMAGDILDGGINVAADVSILYIPCST